MEVDFVGCVFGVTVECSLSSSSLLSSREEGFATVDSIVYGGPGAGSSSSSGGPRDGPSAKVVGLASPRAATAAGAASTDDAVTGAPPDDEFVIYRVYLTDVSGTIVVLKKRIRRELARHHRILRSVPGACWAIVNAGRGDRTPSPSSAVLGTRPCSDRGVRTVLWSSTTAVGGNGCAPPPRSIGGAPAGHLERPLLALRRWVEGGEGRNAISREGQRLALLLAKERRFGAAGASPSPNVAAVAGEVHAEEEEISPPLSRGAATTVAGVASAVPAVAAAPGGDTGGDVDSGAKRGRTSGLPQGMATLVPTTPAGDTVVGFVSSFAFHVDFPSPVVAAVGQRGCAGGERSRDDRSISLSLNVDTGERVLAVVLPKASLRMLLGLTLGHDNDHPLVMRGGSPTAEPEDRGIGASGDQMLPTKRFPNGTAQDLLNHAIAVLGGDDAVRLEEGASGVHNGESEPGISTPEVAVAAAVAAARSTVGDNATAASPPSMAIAGGRQHQHQSSLPAVAPNSETTIDALVSAVCRLFCGGQQQSYHHTLASAGGAGAPSPGIGRMTAPTVAGSSAVRAKVTLTTEGLDEGVSRSATGMIGDIGRAGSLADVFSPPMQPSVSAEGGKEAGADDDTTSAEPTANPDGVGHGRAARALAEPSGGSLDCVRLRGLRCDSLREFLDELAVACGGKQIAFSISRYFSLKLSREVGVVQGVGCVDVARSSENLLKDLADSHVPPP